MSVLFAGPGNLGRRLHGGVQMADHQSEELEIGQGVAVAVVDGAFDHPHRVIEIAAHRGDFGEQFVALAPHGRKLEAQPRQFVRQRRDSFA